VNLGTVMKEIEIFGRHTSYNVQKVLWLADELELNYSHVQIGGRFVGNDSTDFLQMNPLGKVPVLRHGDKLIWESNTIVRYLADSQSNNTWIASTPYEKSLSERWMDWSIGKLEPTYVGVFWGFYRTPPDRRNNREIEKSIVNCNLCLSQIGKQLANKCHLVGDNPTVADIAIGVFLHRLWSIDLEIEFPDNVRQWYERLTERAAYHRWVMSDFTELQGRSDY
jgi:glutathione S-transferase